MRTEKKLCFQRLYSLMPNSHRPPDTSLCRVRRCESSHRPTGAICVGVRPAVAPAVPAPPDDAERTSRAVGPTQFTPPHQTRQNSPVCHVCCAGVNWKTALNVFRDFKFSVGNSLELSAMQFTPSKRTRRSQDSFVVSGVAV